MLWSIVAIVFSVLLDLFNLHSMLNHEKDFEILILRHQLAILERKQPHPIRHSIAEKLTLAVLTNQLKTISKRPTSQLRNVLRIFQPETVLKWRRELVRCKWTRNHRNKGGRPRIDHELEALIVRLAEEDPRWGYGKIEPVSRAELVPVNVELFKIRG